MKDFNGAIQRYVVHLTDGSRKLFRGANLASHREFSAPKGIMSHAEKLLQLLYSQPSLDDLDQAKEAILSGFFSTYPNLEVFIKLEIGRQVIGCVADRNKLVEYAEFLENTISAPEHISVRLTVFTAKIYVFLDNYSKAERLCVSVMNRHFGLLPMIADILISLWHLFGRREKVKEVIDLMNPLVESRNFNSSILSLSGVLGTQFEFLADEFLAARVTKEILNRAWERYNDEVRLLPNCEYKTKKTFLIEGQWHFVNGEFEKALECFTVYQESWAKRFGFTALEGVLQWKTRVYIILGDKNNAKKCVKRWSKLGNVPECWLDEIGAMEHTADSKVPTGTVRGCSHPYCNKVEMHMKEFLVCAKCKCACYCSRACQKAHWKNGGHKKECGKVYPGINV